LVFSLNNLFINKYKQMKAIKFIYAAMCCTMFCSCDFKCSIGNNKSDVKIKPVTSDDNTTLNGAIIKNDIDIEATGVKLKAAYLVDESENLLKENIVNLNQKIYVVLKTDTGWVKENGKSFLGAAERISTSAGGVVVDAADIFKEQETTGLDASDAKVVSLSAVIRRADPGVDHFVVRFRVWDKKANSEIKGKYKFVVRK
jgi:hypothetical protein